LSGAPYTQASTQVSVYALRVTAAPFGSSAPNWYALSPVLTNSGSDGQQHSSAPYQDNWDQGPENQNSPAPSLADSSPPSSPPSPVPPPGASLYYYIPPPGDWPYIFLDGTVNQLNYSAQNPGWAVLMTDGPTYQIVQVVDTRQVGKTGYSISAKSTRLTLIDTINQLFPLRNTTILTGSESLAVQTDLPIPDPVSGASLILAGMYAGLQDGQTVVLQGIVYASAGTAAPVTAAEMCILQGAPAVDTVNNVTTVNLKAPLTNQYLRSSCTLLANVATMTQGQTVPDEILGSGDGTAFQSWPLKQKPLTYLPSTDPDGLSTVSSTLLVTVNGVAWSEEPNLASSGPHDQVFMTTEDGTGQTTVVFGDGINGACPPTGTNNVHASYRKGLGSGGNLSAGAVQQMLGSLPGLQKVTSPMSTGGGDDADTPADIRSQAPAALQTFGRAVSVTDYAALALSYPGIAKALAAWVLQDPATGLIVAHPYVQLTVASVDEQPIAGSVLATNLRLFLDSHRDPNVLLRIQDYTPVYIAVAVSVQIDDRYPHQGTLNLVQAALNPGVNPDGTKGFFAFERMQFGESVYLSAVYAVIQAVPGVDSALIATLQPVDAGSGVTPQDISAGPTEIVVVDPSAEPASVLSITGQGGYPDS
jgi:predicted phage baseplate assembly protein